ncbi:TetR/AcrR family transcriptional regulator [Lactobacillus sp. ESL0791]|uniref:TetR/AcrR family transcriptional regulator n=1 Tax=Lactobacillus sp. ESL0791 TaxID=2983234 RepID=UPI0023F7CEDD|nr:TetR/AcrR family transcriptional regulator [Lactobacillus sp. ESL0791]MDF7638145.1 TetR/AcrR family transcriptional regulator [Lactobacillus sp. ESL0791]
MARRKNMERRRVILRNTFQLIREYGMDGVSFQMIAEETGISKSLLQSYYPHKEKLISDIIHNLFHTLGTQIEDYNDIVKNQPFAFTKSFVYTVALLGEYDDGIDRIITDVFTRNETLNKWCGMLCEWVSEAGLFDEVNPNEREVNAGIAFVTTGMVRLYCNRRHFNLTPEQIADYTTKAFMYSFMHCSTKQVDQALKLGNEMVKKADVKAIYKAVDTMFNKGKEFFG